MDYSRRTPHDTGEHGTGKHRVARSADARSASKYPYRWKKQITDGGGMAVAADDQVVSMSEYKALQMRIRKL